MSWEFLALREKAKPGDRRRGVVLDRVILARANAGMRVSIVYNYG